MSISEIRKVKDAAYGPPLESLGTIGGVWQAYLEMRLGARFNGIITADIVADLHTIEKVFRRAYPHCPSKSLVDCGKDIVGYSDIATETDARISEEDRSIPPSRSVSVM